MFESHPSVDVAHDDTIVVVQSLPIGWPRGFTLGLKSGNLMPCQMSLLPMLPATLPICSTMSNTVVSTTPSFVVVRRWPISNLSPTDAE